MRFTFLGTGTSAGIPAIGCDCAVCTSSDPRDRRLRTAAAVQWRDPRGIDRTVLIDASPDLREQALRAKLRTCDGVLFTHNHVDHTFGLDEVRRFNAIMQRPIDIWAEDRTLEHLRRVYKHIFDKEDNVQDSFVATLIVHRIEPAAVERADPIELHGMRFTPIRLLHGRLPVLGWRIEPADSLARAAPQDPGPKTQDPGPFPLAYCTDVSGIPPESWARFRGIRTLVLDALRHRRHPTHYTLGEAVGVAHEIGAAHTWFVHMAHDLSHAETDASLPDGMHLAYDGLVLE